MSAGKITAAVSANTKTAIKKRSTKWAGCIFFNNRKFVFNFVHILSINFKMISKFKQNENVLKKV